MRFRSILILALFCCAIAVSVPAAFQPAAMLSVSAAAQFPNPLKPVITPTAVTVPLVNLSTIPDLEEHHDIYFDPATLRTFVHRCPPNQGYGVWEKNSCPTAVDTGYTFEKAGWSGGVNPLRIIRGLWDWSWRLNPLDFATEETARKMLAWVKWQGTDPGGAAYGSAMYARSQWSINNTYTRVTGPYERTPQWMVCGDDGQQVECWSAGQMAVRLIRNPPAWAGSSWIAEVRLAFGR